MYVYICVLDSWYRGQDFRTVVLWGVVDTSCSVVTNNAAALPLRTIVIT